MRQHAAAAACVRQQAEAAGSTIAMGYSDGSGQPVAQLRWAAAAAAAQRTAGWWKNCNEQQALGGAVAEGGSHPPLPQLNNNRQFKKTQLMLTFF
jgi:hypothetical protein